MADKRKSSMVEKDNVCRDFVKGFCRFEGKCRFEHPGEEGGKRASIEPNICKDYARGNCEYGARCRFKHPVACKDFLAGKCTFPNCRFYHPPGAQGATGPPMSGGPSKRPHDNDELPPQFCRDFVYVGVCRRPRCSYLHEMPNKRRPGPDGPFPSGGPGWNDGPVGGPSGPDGDFVNPELKAYVSQLELKVTMYEEKIKDLEKRCDQYEDLNKLLTERNDELKAKLQVGPSGGYQGYQTASGGAGGYQTSSGGYQTASAGGYKTPSGQGGYQDYQQGGSGGTGSQGGHSSSNSRASTSRPKYYN